MKSRLLLLVLSVCTLVASCDLFTSHGKKVTFGKSEVYYKGEGVTEAQAKAVGEFLEEKQWFTEEAPGSAQLTKEDDIYMVRLVLADPNDIAESLRLTMWKQQYDLSQDVFDGKDARFVFTDNKFKDLDVLDPVAKVAIGKSSVYYDDAEFKKKDVQKLGDFFQEKGYLSEEKAVDVFLTLEDESPVIRLIVDKKRVEENEETVMPVFSYWQELIREDVLDNNKVKMVLATVRMNDFKTVPKLSAEMRAKIEQPETPTETDNTLTNIDSVSTQTTVSGIERLQNE